MIITAKFSSFCPCCKSRIGIGEKVEWSAGVKACHVTCAGKPAIASTSSARSSHRSRGGSAASDDETARVRTTGVAYIRTRAALDGRVARTLLDIDRYRTQGRTADARRSRTTLDDLIYARHNGAPLYTRADVTMAAILEYEADLRRG